MNWITVVLAGITGGMWAFAAHLDTPEALALGIGVGILFSHIKHSGKQQRDD